MKHKIGWVVLVALAACAAVPDASGHAWLGLETRAPLPDEAQSLELAFDVRQQGRVVERVEPGSPAARAGLRAGDVIVRAGGVELYSHDDLADVVRVSRPGATLELERISASDDRRSTVTVVLDRAPDAPPELQAVTTSIQWQFAGLAGLESALELAATRGQGVLVGLSGAET